MKDRARDDIKFDCVGLKRKIWNINISSRGAKYTSTNHYYESATWEERRRGREEYRIKTHFQEAISSLLSLSPSSSLSIRMCAKVSPLVAIYQESLLKMAIHSPFLPLLFPGPPSSLANIAKSDLEHPPPVPPSYTLLSLCLFPRPKLAESVMHPEESAESSSSSYNIRYALLLSKKKKERKRGFPHAVISISRHTLPGSFGKVKCTHSMLLKMGSSCRPSFAY